MGMFAVGLAHITVLAGLLRERTPSKFMRRAMMDDVHIKLAPRVRRVQKILRTSAAPLYRVG